MVIGTVQALQQQHHRVNYVQVYIRDVTREKTGRQGNILTLKARHELIFVLTPMKSHQTGSQRHK